MGTETKAIGENPKDSSTPPKRDVTKHVVIAYEPGHALVPESLKKTLGGKIEFVEHKICNPPSPISSFLNGESDLFLTKKCQLAYLQGCVKMAVHGGSSPEYLLAPLSEIKRLQQSPLIHGLLLGLATKYPDFMIFPVFGLKYQTPEEYAQVVAQQAALDKPKDPYYQGDMD